MMIETYYYVCIVVHTVATPALWRVYQPAICLSAHVVTYVVSIIDRNENDHIMQPNYCKQARKGITTSCCKHHSTVATPAYWRVYLFMHILTCTT